MPDHTAPLGAGHDTYATSTRADILPLVDRRYPHVLDVGCSAGNTGALLKARGLCERVTGIEPFAATAALARHKLDHVIEKPVEAALDDIPDLSVDCILCLDVLEHLVDPWATVERLSTKLKPGGAFITSVPNVRHVQVLFNLLVRGRFRYTDSGILDRTHLRFFTRESALALMQTQSLAIEQSSGLLGPLSKGLNTASLGLFKDLLIGQYLMRSRKAA